MVSLLRVRLGDALVALPALAVQEVVRAVAITALPGAPAIVEGVINVRGNPVAVIDVRGRLRMDPRAPDPDEFLVIATAGPRTIAFRVDDVDDVVEGQADPVDAGALSPSLRGLAGIGTDRDGVLVIFDPAAFVSQAESDAIDAALASAP